MNYAGRVWRGPTWLVQTARLQLERLLAGIYVRVRRAPIVVSDVPRPLRPASGFRPMRLTHVVVSSDLNPRYVECWPTARRVWSEIAGLEALLVLIADEEDLPAELLDDPGVELFPPIAGLHTAFQAQCIRLLFPALVQTDGAVLISDIDMVPLSREYFHAPTRRIPADHFLAYRDALMYGNQIPICYNAAAAATWRAVFGIEGPADVRRLLGEWGSSVVYEGVRGGRGWDTDQVILYRALTDRARAKSDVWILRDAFSGMHRLNGALISPTAPERVYERGIRKGRYSDYHALLPIDEHSRINDFVIDLAIASAS
jgi:hypothetical protein